VTADMGEERSYLLSLHIPEDLREWVFYFENEEEMANFLRVLFKHHTEDFNVKIVIRPEKRRY